LKCIRKVYPDGRAILPNPKHVEKAKVLLGMEGCQSVGTPHTDILDEDESEELAVADGEIYKKVNGILQFHSKYRTDLQFPAKVIGRRARCPTVNAMLQ